MTKDITYDTKNWLPTTKKEVERLGWDYIDIIIFSGDAYIDHPSFGMAVIGRVLQNAGYRVAIVPQPNWRDDLRDFKKLGKPRLFFGISPGAMDSMINHYTASKRLRSNDAYTPDGRPDMRPDYPTIVYSKILKKLFPHTPIVAGGIEASLRRLTHYDYWQDRLLPGIPFLTPVDLVIYGMGEQAIVHIADELNLGKPIESLRGMPQVAFYEKGDYKHFIKDNDILLYSFEDAKKDKLKHALNFKHIEEQSNSLNAKRLIEPIEDGFIVVNPPYPLMSEKELDKIYDLPYTRLPHPKYKGKHIPAYEMIKHSVNLHRGCFGGCSFCTISAHQGKFIVSRSKRSILSEVDKISQMQDFKGYISDLGGPSANMYKMKGRNLNICNKCLKPSCIFPKICPNLNADHAPLNEILNEVDKNHNIKKAFISSGIRYDLLITSHKNKENDTSAKEYMNRVISNHTSGRLKVAPEHTSDKVLNLMRKPSFRMFYDFKREFDNINKESGLNQQLIPYFISSHPGCTEEDMAELAAKTKSLNFKLEQVQDFTPTPMTLATTIFYTGYNPYTKETVYTATSPKEKEKQKQYFFWYKPELRRTIQSSLLNINRPDLLKVLFPQRSYNKRRKRNKNRRN